MPIERPGRRERRKQETRRALIHAALRLATERGVDGVTVEMITDAADVSPRTFFNYFSSKDEALVCLVESDGLLATLEAHEVSGDPFVALRAVVREHAAAVMDDAAEWRMRLALIRSHPDLKARFAATLEPLEQGMIEVVARRWGFDAERDVYPSLVCVAALAAGRIALRLWLETGGERAVTALVDEAFDLIAAGIPPPDRLPADPSAGPSAIAS
ncbi:MAG: TetR family transcriptional regulator [Actinomycetota bacterium]|nr:TetR family transcriptional regulator [Actinomycetota bacterium]